MSTMRRLGVLLWKEWRQTRALFAVIVAAFLAWAVGVRVWEAIARPEDELLSIGVAAFAAIAGALFPAMAIAEERRGGTLAFLLARPLGRRSILAAKLLVSALLWLAVLGLAWGLCATLVRPEGRWRLAMSGAVCWGMPVFCSALCVSPLVRRHATALVGGVLLGAGVGLFTAGALRFPLVEWSGHPMDDALDALRLAMGAVIHLLLLAVADAALDQEVAAESPRQLAAGLVKGMVIISAVLVALAAALGGGLWALQRSTDLREAESILDWQVSPDGQHIGVSATFPQRWWRPVPWHCGIVDTTTGEARLLSPSQMSMSFSLSQGWSPDGRHWVYHRSAGLFDAFAERLGGSRSADSLVLFDTKTGNEHPVSVDALSHPVHAWWLSDVELVVEFYDHRYYCYSLTTQQLTPVLLPEDSGELLPVGGVMRAATLALWRTEEEGEGLLAVYEPDVTGWLTRPLAPRTTVLGVSSDHRFALLHRGAGLDAGGTVGLLDLRSGSTTTLAETRARWSYGRFSRGGHLIYSTRRRRESKGPTWRLYELDAGTSRALAEPAPSGEWYPRFAAGGTKLLWTHFAPASSDEDGARTTLGFRVQALRPGAPQTSLLPAVARSQIGKVGRSEPVGDALFFQAGELALYRVGLDGTGLEQLFPGKRAITAETPK